METGEKKENGRMTGYRNKQRRIPEEKVKGQITWIYKKEVGRV